MPNQGSLKLLNETHTIDSNSIRQTETSTQPSTPADREGVPPLLEQRAVNVLEHPQETEQQVTSADRTKQLSLCVLWTGRESCEIVEVQQNCYRPLHQRQILHLWWWLTAWRECCGRMCSSGHPSHQHPERRRRRRRRRKRRRRRRKNRRVRDERL